MARRRIRGARGRDRRGRQRTSGGIDEIGLGEPSLLASNATIPPYNQATFALSSAIQPADGTLVVVAVANAVNTPPSSGNGSMAGGGLTWARHSDIPANQSLYRMDVFSAVADGGSFNPTFTQPTGGSLIDDAIMSVFGFANYGAAAETTDATTDVNTNGGFPYSEPFDAGSGDYTLSCLSAVLPGAPTEVGPLWASLFFRSESFSAAIETRIAGRMGGMTTVDWDRISISDGMCLVTVSFKPPA